MAGTLVVAGALPAWAGPDTDYSLPFACGDTWVGTSRTSHSPSKKAVDFNRIGDFGASVVAPALGRVVRAAKKPDGGYGRWVVIDHLNGESSLFAHLDKVTVRSGQFIDKGQLIGTVGRSGRVTGPHLHFEERIGSRVIKPRFEGARYRLGTSISSANCVDVPLAGNLTAGAAAEVAVWRRSTRPTLQQAMPDGSTRVTAVGRGTDEPVLGDWDGDGVLTLGVRGPRSRTFVLSSPSGTTKVRYGGASDRPIAGNWDGVGGWEVGIFRPRKGQFRLRAADGSTTKIAFGTSSDVPVTGDWDGNGITDLGVYDVEAGTYTLRWIDAGGAENKVTVPFGTSGGLPVVGDWDGNGRSDLGAWDRSTATFQQRRAPSVIDPPTEVRSVVFGRPC